MSRKRLVSAFLLVLLLGALFVGRALEPAWAMATGYAAKQLCSGVFVAGLPAEFVSEHDIGQALSLLGPLRSSLEVRVTEPGVVLATLFGGEAKAVFKGEEGCVLNPDPGLKPSPTQRLPAITNASPGWEIVHPAASLQPLFDEAFSEPDDGQRLTLAIVVMHRGEIIGERYAAPATPRMPLQGWSMNKSLMATWIGLQVERGAMHLQASVRDAVAELDVGLAQNVAEDLDLSHLLHMESGFRFREDYRPGDDVTRMLFRSPAMWRIAPGNGHSHDPGEVFSYSSGDTNLASMMWMRSLGGQNYMEWVNEEFVRPLGLEGLTSETDAAGYQVGSSFTYMPARSWARVGQFWLDAYHGRRQELSQSWLRASVTPRAANHQGNYGRGFWLNTRGDHFEGLPTDVFAATGHNSQYVMVLPEQELVVVRLGLSENQSVNGFLPFVRGLLGTLQP